MNIKIPICVIIGLLCNYFQVGTNVLSKEEDLELENQIRLINKPAVATATTIYGDVYDCIDFYKQPAFDHILLKNHTFTPEMDYKYENKKNTNNSSSINENQFKIFKDGGCPVGSVPIRRTTKIDLIREKEYSSKFESLERDNPDLAIVQTSEGYGPFNGAGMIAGVYKPKASGLQYSGVRLKLQRNEDMIQIGWRVDPYLNGDDQTRFYTYFKAGETQCFNTKCPGFVLVNKDYPVDYIFQNYYKIGDKTGCEVQFYIARDPTNGNWWVEVGDNIRLGFWPVQLFSSLNILATYVDWGGEVYNTNDKKEIDMGLGEIPFFKEIDRTAYCRLLQVSTPDGKTSDAAQTQSYSNEQNHYNILNIDDGGDYYRHIILYGGPYKNF